MARVRFIGEGEACAVFGRTFRRGRWITNHGLSDDIVAVLAGNPTFEVKSEAGGDSEGEVEAGDGETPCDPEPPTSPDL